MAPTESSLNRSERTLNAIDQVFRQVDREIWIVTAASGEQRAGLTATWVSQASIDPQAPSVLIGLAPNHETARIIQQSGTFGLHLLSTDQVEVAWNFARDSSRERDKFLEAPARTSSEGIPLLNDCRGWLTCRVVQRLAVADRWYFWADVLDGILNATHHESPDTVLTERTFFQTLAPSQRQILISHRDADIELQRPWIEKWRIENCRIENCRQNQA